MQVNTMKVKTTQICLPFGVSMFTRLLWESLRTFDLASFLSLKRWIGRVFPIKRRPLCSPLVTRPVINALYCECMFTSLSDLKYLQHSYPVHTSPSSDYLPACA